MNKYELRVNNAVIPCEGLNEWSAMEKLGIFEIGNKVECLWYDPGEKEAWDPVPCVGWIYQVELNNKLTLAFIKRIG